MSPGSRCLWEGDVLRKKTSLEGDVPSKRTFLGRCHPQRAVPGKKVSLGRYHLLEGDIPRKDVPGKVSSTGRCLWKSVRKRMSLGRCNTQEGDVSDKMSPGRHSPGKMFPGSRHIWEGDVPRKETTLGRCHPLEGDLPGKMSFPAWMSQGRHHLQGCITGKKMSQERRHPLGRRYSPSNSPNPWSPSSEETQRSLGSRVAPRRTRKQHLPSPCSH